MEAEKEIKLSFLDVEIICKQGKFTIIIYRKPTFSGVYTNYESFLPAAYKFGIIYPINFIEKCFKNLLNNIYLVKENVPTVKKKCLLLVLPYLGITFLHTRTKI